MLNDAMYKMFYWNKNWHIFNAQIIIMSELCNVYCNKIWRTLRYGTYQMLNSKA